MFEHFGLRDVIAFAFKFKIVFIIVMVFSILFGGYVQYKQSKPVADDSDDGTYTATAYFSVDDKNNDTSSGLITDNGKESEIKRLAITYPALVTDDVSNSYVYDKILSVMSKKDFLAKAKLDTSDSGFSPADLKKIIICKTTDSTAIFSVAVTTKSKSISEQLLNYYTDYLINNIQPTVKANTLTLVGTDTSKAASSNTRSSKPMIIAVGGGFMLYLLFIFTWTLFWPTINRKSDFEQYKVKVIAEL